MHALMELCGNNALVGKINMRALQLAGNCHQTSSEEITLIFGDEIKESDAWMFDSLQQEQLEFLFGTYNPCPESTLLPPHLIARPNSNERR